MDPNAVHHTWLSGVPVHLLPIGELPKHCPGEFFKPDGWAKRNRAQHFGSLRHRSLGVVNLNPRPERFAVVDELVVDGIHLISVVRRDILADHRECN